jgi:hypothetical protein
MVSRRNDPTIGLAVQSARRQPKNNRDSGKARPGRALRSTNLAAAHALRARATACDAWRRCAGRISEGKASISERRKQKGRREAGLSESFRSDADQYFATTGLAQLK